MEPENINETTEEAVKTSQLHTVTPLSKYLALALFIILPFVGGWIGYNYAPEKVVEVEKIVEIEKTMVKEVEKVNQESKGFSVQEGSISGVNFSFSHPSDWTSETRIKEDRLIREGLRFWDLNQKLLSYANSPVCCGPEGGPAAGQRFDVYIYSLEGVKVSNFYNNFKTNETFVNNGIKWAKLFSPSDSSQPFSPDVYGAYAEVNGNIIVYSYWSAGDLNDVEQIANSLLVSVD